MTSNNLFARFGPSGRGGRSFYEELRSGEGHGGHGGFDVEDGAGLALDEENLNEQFHDYDLDHADGLGIDGSRTTVDEGAAAGFGGQRAATATATATTAAARTTRETTATTTAARGATAARLLGPPRANVSRSRWGTTTGGGGATGDEDGDNDDVPGSLLVEAQGMQNTPLPPLLKATPLRSNASGRSQHFPSSRAGDGPLPTGPTAMLGGGTKKRREQWEATQNIQRLYGDDVDDGGAGGGGGGGGLGLRAGLGSGGGGGTGGGSSGGGGMPGHALLSYFFPSGGSRRRSTAHDRAMWRWVNVSNLDNFIRDVYDYYRDCGLRCILLERFLHLVNVAFVAVFLTFLTQCIDYTKIRGSTTMHQILVPQCTRHMSWLWNVGLWLFAFYFVWKLMQFFIFDVRRLLHLRDFYVHLLQIPEHDMQTVSWQDVVVKIMALRDQNPKTATNLTRRQRDWVGSQSKERLDAHDIANRLMRRENYLIALFNKDILDLTIPLPFLRRLSSSSGSGSSSKKQLLTRTLEWTLWFGVLDFVFDARGQVNQEFLKASRRSQLSQMLKSRFLFAGFMNLLLAPFVACYLVVVYFLTYYNEYQKNPSALGARAYTPLAEWKFREFNELEHLFEERLNMSYPFATRYLDQFPKRKTEQVAKTVAFVAGSVMTVLAIASLFDPELFLGFEITHDRTVLFYVGIFATVWAAARGMITEENSVFDPEYALRNVIEYTHYEPDHWKGRLHSYDVKVEFAELYQIKIKIFLEEILSIFFTPLILFTSLPRSSDQIIDFFREFTVHVDGLGYVCSFAVFDFHKGVGGGTAKQRPLGPPPHEQQEQQQQAQAQEPQSQLQPDPLGANGGDVRDDYYATKHGKMAASYYGFLDNYVINPKTGIPGHHPPGSAAARHHHHHHAQFHPPPAFPGLNSPTLAADMQSSMLRNRKGAGSSVAALRTPRFGPAASVAQPSPMASILLDPHHQPSASALFANQRFRAATAAPGVVGGAAGGITSGRYGAGVGGDSFIIEESTTEDGSAATTGGGPRPTSHLDDHEEPLPPHGSEGGEHSGTALLDESTWQTSPPTGLSRENSSSSTGGVGDEADVGVLGLMYQFQQAHKNHRMGGVR